MKIRFHTVFLLLLSAMTSMISVTAQSPLELSSEWTNRHISRMDPSQVRHSDVKVYLKELASQGIAIAQVGKSMGQREIYQISFGRGPLKVLLWSQMHGDEPTATSALMDLFAYLQANRNLPWVKALEEKVSLRAVPMLNPDGAELFQRRNLQSIDINRDARLLSTPEAQLLKKLRDDWAPDLGFNLHNQNMRTSVGETGKQATISLLAVPYDQFGNDNPKRLFAKRVCAVIFESLSPFIYGQIARYDDSFNPRAFGDAISEAGTPVVLIETGGWHGHEELELVRLNFVALAMTLKSLADGSIARANPAVYDALRYNSTGDLQDIVIRNGTLVSRGGKGTTEALVFRGDVSVNFERSGLGGRIQTKGQIGDVGDLSIFFGLENVDASGYFVVAANGPIRPNGDPTFLFYRRSSAERIDWNAADLETRFPPDARFKDGQWSGPAIPPRR